MGSNWGRRVKVKSTKHHNDFLQELSKVRTNIFRYIDDGVFKVAMLKFEGRLPVEMVVKFALHLLVVFV